MSRICLCPIIVLSLLATPAFPQTSSPPGDAPSQGNQNADVPESRAAEDQKPKYVRIRRNDRRAAVALETSVIHFGQAEMYPNATVDLIGAIHLGEAEYFENLNRLFRTYDTVLFEAVMPEAAVRRGLRPGGGRRGINLKQEWTEAKVGLHAIGILQEGMQDVLGLEYQLAGVDYTARNFVHADMTQEQFEKTMSDRGESFTAILAREAAKAALMQQKVNPIAMHLDVLISILASDRKYRVRRIAAVELEKANEGDAFAGADGTSTIITERNTTALSVLKKQLHRGQQKIAIFYGAGHFPDMEARVVEEFGFQRLSEQWLTAWHLTDPSARRK